MERNFYCPYGEIDIVCREKQYLVFVEVKYRADTRMGNPEEAVTRVKIQHIWKSAQYYLYKKRYSSDMPVRFDVVVMLGNDIRIIQNAFDAG